MKLAHVFSLVIVLHLAVIGALFVTPGCASDSTPKVVAAEPVGQPSRAQEMPATTSQVVEPPAPVPAPASSVTRYPPTRPSWNLNETTTAEVIVQPEPVQEEEFAYVAEEVQVTEYASYEPAPSAMSSFNSAPTSATTYTPPTEVSASVPGTTYIVKKGDNLSTIARRNGVSLNELMAANGYTRETANRLSIGEALTIPAVDNEAEAPAAVQSPTYTSAAIDQEGVSYIVQRGDSLSRIASTQGSTVSAIKSANGLISDRIVVGQELLIPKVESAPAAVVGVPNAEGKVTYVVKPGDTLGAISKRYDVSVKEIMQVNGIDDPRRLRVDQTIIIPTDLQPVAPKPAQAKRQPAPAAVPAPLQPAMPPAQPVEAEEIDLESLDLDSVESVDVEEVNE